MKGRSFLLLSIISLLFGTIADANSSSSNDDSNSNSSLPSARVSIVPDGTSNAIAGRFFQGADVSNFQQYQPGKTFNIQQDVENAAGSSKP